jgi:hypothetical protein
MAKVSGEDAKALVVHKTVMTPVSALNPAPYNPRRISPRKFEALKANIRLHGFLDPLVVQKNGMNIIGGHQRVKAVKEVCVEDSLSMPELPCVVIDVDDRTAKKLNIALNNVGGDFEASLLGELLDGLHEDEPLIQADVELMGFEDDELGKYLKLSEPPDASGGGDDPDRNGFGRTLTLTLEFSTKEKRDAMKKLLAEHAKTTKKRTGDLVFEAFDKGKKKASPVRRAS